MSVTAELDICVMSNFMSPNGLLVGQVMPAPEQAWCLTDDCDEDPDNGEGWDGYCGNCADRLATCRTEDCGGDAYEGENGFCADCLVVDKVVEVHDLGQAA